MPQVEEITARVYGWIVGQFPLAKELDIPPTGSLLDSGIVDSLGTLEIVLFLEDEFGILVEDDEMVADHFESVESISNFVGSKLMQ